MVIGILDENIFINECITHSEVNINAVYDIGTKFAVFCFFYYCDHDNEFPVFIYQMIKK